MSNNRKSIQVQLRLIGDEDETDGIMEVLMGMFVMMGTLNSIHRSKRTLPGNEVAIYMDIDCAPAPLGNLGTADLPAYTGDQP